MDVGDVGHAVHAVRALRVHLDHSRAGQSDTEQVSSRRLGRGSGRRALPLACRCPAAACLAMGMGQEARKHILRRQGPYQVDFRGDGGVEQEAVVAAQRRVCML